MTVQSREGASPSAQVRVLVALRDTLVSDAFGHLLGDAGFLVTACEPEPQSLTAQVVRAHPDVIVVASEYVTAARLAELRVHAPAARIVVLLRDGGELCVQTLIQHAVNAVIPMDTRTTDAISIIRQVIDGSVIYPSVVLHQGEIAEPELLSERQREVLEQVALGRSNEEIARRLFISRNTVKFHLREIYSRLGVRNRVEAARAAQRALAGASPPPIHPD